MARERTGVDPQASIAGSDQSSAEFHDRLTEARAADRSAPGSTSCTASAKVAR